MLPSVTLEMPLSQALSEKQAKEFSRRRGYTHVVDVLWHIPREIKSRGEFSTFFQLEPGQEATVLARVVKTESRRTRSGHMTVVTASDGHEKITATFFNQKWREREMSPGTLGLFSGNVSEYRGKLQLVHPEFLRVPEEVDQLEDAVEFVRQWSRDLIPIYSRVGELPSWRVANVVHRLLGRLKQAPDPVPAEVSQQLGLMPYRQALESVHQPRSRQEFSKARTSLAFQEAFVLQAVFAQENFVRRSTLARAWIYPTAAPALPELLQQQLPFTLTEDQQKAFAQISADLTQPFPMRRLLQGEVGSGKTVVALLAMLHVIAAGGQAALLAPTEVLARQHTESLRQLLSQAKLLDEGMMTSPQQREQRVRLQLLTGSVRVAQRREILGELISGQTQLVVGTHALLQDKVSFADLGLVVIDEQHRFGVAQRQALVEKATKTAPHQLLMSATPIPRTLALTFLGDMAVSELRHLPKHRTPTATRAFSETEKPEFLSLAWQRVRERAAVGERTFIVCPRIDPQDDIAPALAQGQEQPKAQTHAVLPVAQALEHGALSGLRIGVLHGRQDTQTQQETMARFRQTDGEDALDVLVTTTVIEVGVDVPQATLMVVLDAEYFGMSQLHQLRGRVGRGERPGLCLLVTQQQPDSEAMLRLDLVAQTQDGFELAAEDLRFRREGDLLGVDQSGWQQRLLLLDVLHDEPLVRQAATAVAQQDYDWISPAPVTNTSIRVPHPALRSAMQRLLRERSHMAGVANQDQEESS